MRNEELNHVDAGMGAGDDSIHFGAPITFWANT